MAHPGGAWAQHGGVAGMAPGVVAQPVRAQPYSAAPAGAVVVAHPPAYNDLETPQYGQPVTGRPVY